MKGAQRKGGKRRTIAPGIYADRYGLTVRVAVGSGAHKRSEEASPRFPLETLDEKDGLARMQAWQAETRAKLLNEAPLPVRRGTIAADVPDWLATVPAGGKHDDYERHMRLHWLPTPLPFAPGRTFGDTPREDVRRKQVRAQMKVWQDAGVAANTVNHRVRALRMFYRAFEDDDDADAYNPADKITKLKDPEAEARGIPWDVVELILGNISDRGQPARRVSRGVLCPICGVEPLKNYRAKRCWTCRRGGPRSLPGAATPLGVVARPTVSVTKIRLRVMAWTGMPQMQLERLRRSDVDFARAKVRLSPRRKGKGVKEKWLDLIPPAVDALRDYDAAGLWGKSFSRSSMVRVWRGAIVRTTRQAAEHAEKTGQGALLELLQAQIPPDCKPYDLRHSFGTEAYRVTGDLRAVAELLQQADIRTADRYAKGAVEQRAAMALAEMGKRFAPPAAPAPAAAVDIRRARKRRQAKATLASSAKAGRKVGRR